MSKYLAIIPLILIGIFLINYRIYRVSGYSMYPSIDHHDLIIVRLSSNDITSGDVICVIPPNKRSKVIKRCIATQGDMILFKDSAIYVNNQMIKSVIKNNQRTKFDLVSGDSFVVSNYYLIGDNLNESKDSRHWGEVEEKDIIGRIIYVYKYLNIEK